MQIVQLSARDVDAFIDLRKEGLAGDADGFRYTVADDAQLGIGTWRSRLDRDFVVAAEQAGRWLGIGGFTHLIGDKLDHKGLIWGMYARPESRGRGVADTIMGALISHARARVRLLQLTVMADNGRALSFYKRHGFSVYAIEPQAVRQGAEFRDEALMWLALNPD